MNTINLGPIFICFFIIGFTIQIVLFYTVGQDVLYKLYPLITHVPLSLILVLYLKKSWLTAFVSLICAYLFTLPRHWLGSLFSIILGESLKVPVYKFLEKPLVQRFGIEWYEALTAVDKAGII